MHKQNGGRGLTRTLAALALAGVLLAAGCSKPVAEPAVSEAPPPAPSAAPSPTTAPKAKADAPPSRVVAHTRYGDITLSEINNYGHTGLCTPLTENASSTDTIETLSGPRLEATVKWIGGRMAAMAEIDEKKDPELNRYLRVNLQPQLDNVLFAHMLRNEIMDRDTTPTQEEIAAYYDKTKTVFYQPFSFTIQLLLLETYEPYIVQAGDNLEGIAQLIAGDPKAAANIRGDVPGRPLRREEGKMFKPLVPGERLLVPMNPQRTAEVRTRLDQMLRDVRATTDTHERSLKFTALAKKYDESGLKGEITTPLPTGTRQNKPPLTEIVEAVKSTPVGDVSKVFKTRHGYQAVFVVDRVEPHNLPLSNPDVRAMIVEKLTSDRKEKLTENLVGAMLDNPELKIDYQAIAEKGNRLTSDTVVAALGTEKLLWRDVQGPWKGSGSPADPVRLRKVMMRVQPLVAMLFRQHLKPLLDDPKSELAQQIDVMRTAYLGSVYINKLAAEETAKKVTKDQAREYYEKHKEEMYRTPAKVSYEAACWPLAPEQQELKDAERRQALDALGISLADSLQSVKTAEDFGALKAQLDQKMASQGREPIKADNVPLDGLAPEIQEALSRLKPGQWSGPVVASDRSEVMSLMLKQLIPAGYEPFEQAIDKANRDLFAAQIDAAIKRYEDEFTQHAGVELVAK